jgi:hypothetical protein
VNDLLNNLVPTRETLDLACSFSPAEALDRDLEWNREAAGGRVRPAVEPGGRGRTERASSGGRRVAGESMG